MTTFLDALKVGTGLKRTENGAVTNSSTLDPIVDFFSRAGAMRSNPQGAADLFERAFAEDPQTAARVLFYLRDIRGGQGERAVFQACLKRWAEMPAKRGLEREDIAKFSQILRLVPEYGRWDDLLAIGLGPSVVEIIRDQLRVDLLNYLASPSEQVSLLAKWLPSENASSAKTKRLAKSLRTQLGYTPAEYRRTLSKLRGRIKLLEHDMTRKNWNEIDYGKIPSQAHRKHVKAFHRNTPVRYQDYLDKVTKGEAKINASTLYPYEVYNMAFEGGGATASAAEVMWSNLPDYTDGRDALVMVDVSASMTRRYPGGPSAMSVAVSLGLYFAERNTGAFKDHFMTFSTEPAIVKVTGNTLAERIGNMIRSQWTMSTDLEKAFRAILRAAQHSGAGDLPETLYIVSDMEFNAATGGGFGSQDTIFRNAKREFAAAGFELPHVVFWNVYARNMQSPATILDGAVSLVSGCSPSIFSQAVNGKSPRQLVDSVVNSERYARIVL